MGPNLGPSTHHLFLKKGYEVYNLSKYQVQKCYYQHFKPLFWVVRGKTGDKMEIFKILSDFLDRFCIKMSKYDSLLKSWLILQVKGTL